MHEDGVAAAESVMTFVSYAQNFEDVLLWRALADVENGRYIDIGAQHPVVDSVSLAFYKAGWRGIHVEPAPYYAGLLREARPDETVIEAAVTDAQGPIDFYEIVGTGLSTGSQNIAHHHRPLGFEQRKLTVPCVRLDSLFEAAGDTAHWIKIDVEGMEADVLRSWGDSPARPWILVIESTFPGSQNPAHQEWILNVLDRAYVETFYDGLSRYFVHGSQAHLKAAFEAPANVFDGFVVTRDHFSARANRENLERAEERNHKQEAAHAELAAQLSGASEELAAERSRTGDLEERLAAAVQSLAAMREETAAAASQLAQAQASQAAIARELADVSRQYAATIDAAARDRQAAEAELAAEIDRYQAALEQSRSAVMRADALIRAAQQPPGRWRSLGQFLGLARPPLAWRALATWSLPGTGDPNPLPATQEARQETTTTMHNPAGQQARNPYLRANSLAELLAWYDVDFVRCAYVTVLGRQPDPEGEEYYTDRLRRGHSKHSVLWQLRTSSEGPSHDPGIAGFDKELRRHRNARDRRFGWLVRLITGREADTRWERRLRAIENLLGSTARTVAPAEIGPALRDVLATQLTSLIEARDASHRRAEAGMVPEPAEYGEVRGRLSPRAQKLYDCIFAAK
jgi:FkbM family methyltransferase